MPREPMTAMLLRLPPSHAARIRRLAGRLGMRQAVVLRWAVAQLLAKHPEPEVAPEPAPAPATASDRLKVLCDALDAAGVRLDIDPSRLPGNGAVGPS